MTSTEGRLLLREILEQAMGEPVVRPRPLYVTGDDVTDYRIRRENLADRIEALFPDATREARDEPTMLFSCPHCGEPCARTVESEVDIHGGATYRCELCNGQVVFEALTPEEYTRPIRGRHELRAKEPKANPNAKRLDA